MKIESENLKMKVNTEKVENLKESCKLRSFAIKYLLLATTNKSLERYQTLGITSDTDSCNRS
jgi:hypothetical protein